MSPVQGDANLLSVSIVVARPNQRVCLPFPCGEDVGSLTPGRVLRRIGHLSDQIEEYESLLRDIGPYVDGRAADSIESMLSKVGTEPGMSHLRIPPIC